MAWSVRSSGAAVSAVYSTINPTGLITIASPAGATTNDLILIYLVHHGTTWATFPAGFDSSATRNISGTTRVELAIKRSVGAEAGTYAITCPGGGVMAARSTAIRGMLQSGTFLSSSITQANASGTTGCASLDNVPDGCLLVIQTGTGVQATVTPATSHGVHVASGYPATFVNLTNSAGSGVSDLPSNPTTTFYGFSCWENVMVQGGDTGALGWDQTSAGENVGIMAAFLPEPNPPSAPPNTTPVTAIAITSLPTTVTGVDATDGLGTTYDLWYKYTAVDGDNVIGIFGHGQDLVTYLPQTLVYESLTDALNGDASIDTTSGIVLPVMVATVPGETYYLEFNTNGNATPATLSYNAQRFTDVPVPRGSIVVPGDAESATNTGFPVSFIDSTTDHTFLAFQREFAHSEYGDVLSNGRVLMFDDTNVLHLELFDNTYALSATINDVPVAGGGDRYIRTNVTTDRWWVAQRVSTSLHACYVDSTGAPGTVHTIASSASLRGIATNAAETILYYTIVGATVALKRIDLTTNTDLSDLAAGITNLRMYDLLVLADDTIVALYYNSGATKQVTIKHYDTAGAVLHTFDLGTNHVLPNGDPPRLAYALEADEFWVWSHHDSGTEILADFQRCNVTSGTVEDTITVATYEFGVNAADQTLTPAYRFGTSQSCPFFVAFAEVLQPPEDVGTPSDFPMRYLRRSPIISDQEARIYHSRAQVVMQGGIGTTTGQGQDPQCMMRFSDDGGHTYGYEAWRSIGEKGNYNARVLYYRLGQTRNRVYEVTVSDPACPVTLIDLVLDLARGEN